MRSDGNKGIDVETRLDGGSGTVVVKQQQRVASSSCSSGTAGRGGASSSSSNSAWWRQNSSSSVRCQTAAVAWHPVESISGRARRKATGRHDGGGGAAACAACGVRQKDEASVERQNNETDATAHEPYPFYHSPCFCLSLSLSSFAG